MNDLDTAAIRASFTVYDQDIRSIKAVMGLCDALDVANAKLAEGWAKYSEAMEELDAANARITALEREARNERVIQSTQLQREIARAEKAEQRVALADQIIAAVLDWEKRGWKGHPVTLNGLLEKWEGRTSGELKLN